MAIYYVQVVYTMVVEAESEKEAENIAKNSAKVSELSNSTIILSVQRHYGGR